MNRLKLYWPSHIRICYTEFMSDALKDREVPQLPAGTTPVAGHDAWFKQQVELGLREAKETPDDCVPMEDVLKDLDL